MASGWYCWAGAGVMRTSATGSAIWLAWMQAGRKTYQESSEVHWAVSRQHEIRAFWRARSKLAWAWLSTCQAGIPRLFPFELFGSINAAVLAA